MRYTDRFRLIHGLLVGNRAGEAQTVRHLVADDKFLERRAVEKTAARQTGSFPRLVRVVSINLKIDVHLWAPSLKFGVAIATDFF